MKTILFGFAAFLLLASCNHAVTKKILVMSKGKATIDKAAKTINVPSGGTSHEEQTVELTDAGSITLQVTTDNGKNPVDIPSNGYYVLNTKVDTMIGSYQAYNAPSAQSKTITQESIKHSIDSLQQLLQGNASAANKTFYILPGKAVKITDNMDATLVGPFNSLTTLEQTGDKAPEVYKFYTSKDVRETLAHLQSLTVAAKSPNQ